MSKKIQRQNDLVRVIQAQGMLPVRTLATMLDVSEMTVRRDLEALQYQTAEATNAISDAQGGEYNLLNALERANEQKNRIGRFATSLIETGDVIVIDTGSTTARMLPYIPDNQNLTVLCYNANVMLDLRYKPGIQLLFCGGAYHPNTEMFESPEGIHFIQRTRASKAFLSAAGIHQRLGVTCANIHEVPTKTAVIKSSLQRILLADSSKFGQLRSAYFCELGDVHAIVTDKSLPEEWQQYIRGKGIALYLV